mgnify:CR=1 FL=1
MPLKASSPVNNFFWIDKSDAEQLSEPLQKIRSAANAAVEEFEKVVRVRRDTQHRTSEVQKNVGPVTERHVSASSEASPHFGGRRRADNR